MPAAFVRCVKKGGRVRTLTKGKGLKSGQYRKICFPKGGGDPVLGEIKTNVKAKVLKK